MLGFLGQGPNMKEVYGGPFTDTDLEVCYFSPFEQTPESRRFDKEIGMLLIYGTRSCKVEA